MKSSHLNMSQYSDLYDSARQIGASVGAAILALLYINRKRSNDKKLNHKDEAESSILDKVISERDKASAEIDRQRAITEEVRKEGELKLAEVRQELRISQEALSESRETAFRNAVHLENCEKNDAALRNTILRQDADILDWRKKVRRLERSLRRLDPNHPDVEHSDFSPLDE